MKLTKIIYQELKLKYKPTVQVLRNNPVNREINNKILPGVLKSNLSLSFKDLKFSRGIWEYLERLSINWKYPTNKQCKILNVLKSNYSVNCKIDPGSGKTMAMLLYCLDLKYKRIRTRETNDLQDSRPGVISPRSVLLVNNSNSVIALKHKIEKMFNNEKIDEEIESEYPSLVKYLYRSTPEEEAKQVESLIDDDYGMDEDYSGNQKRYIHQPCHLIIATPQRLNDILSYDPSIVPSFKFLKFIGVDDVELQICSFSENKKISKRKQNLINSSISNPAIKSSSCELFFERLILPKLKYDKNVFFHKYDRNGYLCKGHENNMKNIDSAEPEEDDPNSSGIQTAFLNSFDDSGSLQKIIKGLNKEICKNRQLIQIGNLKPEGPKEKDNNDDADKYLKLPYELPDMNFETYVLTAKHDSGKQVSLNDVNLPDFPSSEGAIIHELNEYEDFDDIYKKNFKKAKQSQSKNKIKNNSNQDLITAQRVEKLISLMSLPKFKNDDLLIVFPDNISIIGLVQQSQSKLKHEPEKYSTQIINLNSFNNIPPISNKKRNLAFINLHNLKGVNFPHQGLNFQTIVVFQPIDILLQNFQFNLPMILTRCMRDQNFPTIGILNAKQQFDYLLEDISNEKKNLKSNSLNGKIVMLSDLDDRTLELEDSMYLYRKLLSAGIKHCKKLNSE